MQQSVFSRTTICDVLRLAGKEKPNAHGKLHCPLHDDPNPSFKVVAERGFICYGCGRKGGVADLVVALGHAVDRPAAAEWLIQRGQTGEFVTTPRGKVVAEYPYHDRDGKTLFVVERIEPKAFRQKRPDGKGGWQWSLNGTPRVPYRLQELEAACKAGGTVLVLEGEKDCERARALGIAATTNAGGTGWPWPRPWAEYFRGAGRVIVVADNDEPGKKAARARAALVASTRADVRLIEALPGVGEKGDLSDFIDAGRTIEDLLRFAAQQPTIQSNPGRGLNMITLADVEPESIEWLWKGRIPRSKVSLLVGDPGSGKSFASLAISASVTHGKELPDEPSDCPRLPGAAILWNGEDGIEDTIRVRAEACGVNLQRIHVIDSARNDDGRRVPFSLNSVSLIGEEIERLSNVHLVVIDPIAALLGDVETHRDADVRAALQPLADLARRYKVAVLCVLHLRKSEAQRALYRVGGSIGFVGLARSVLLVARDDENGRRAIVPIKQNLSAPVDPVEFRIDEAGFWWSGTAPDLSAEHLLRSVSTQDSDDSKIIAAVDFLEDKLADGELPALDVEASATQRQISGRTLRRACKEAGVKKRREGFSKQGKWYWSLPLMANKPIDVHTNTLDTNDDSWPPMENAEAHEAL